MLSKLAHPEKTQPIAVSPNTGYSSWFNVWKTTQTDEAPTTNIPDTKETPTDSSTDTFSDINVSDNEIFKLSEDDEHKNEQSTTSEEENEEEEEEEEEKKNVEEPNDTKNSKHDKYLGSKKTLFDDDDFPYNYSLLHEDIIKPTSVFCSKKFNNIINYWNKSSDVFKVYSIGLASIYFNIAEYVAIYTLTYAFLSKTTKSKEALLMEKWLSSIDTRNKNNYPTVDDEPVQADYHEETCDADAEESSDAGAASD